MDFFDRQDRARRTSRFLVAAFALSFAAVVLATTALAGFVVRLYSPRETAFAVSATFGEWALEHAGVLGAIALGTLALLTFASLYRAASLAGGGGQVARLLGGSELSSDVTDLPRKRLLNVVEEMAIASGLPMPEVYVLEREAGINAFAAGLTQSDAAIAVTRGALEQLDRAELQGVIAHEFSHIVNGDMRLNQQLIGFSFGILVLSLIGRWLLRAAHLGRRGRSSGGAVAAVALGVGFVVIGSIGLLLSRLIKAAVSRERERLADASALQFTRDTDGLASALKKIGGFGSRLTSVESEEVAHMLFEHHGRAFRGWFATHPPLLERIRALDPGFEASSLRELSASGGARAAAGFAADTERVSALQEAAGHDERLGDIAYRSDESPLARAGEMGSPALGAGLRSALPAEIYDAAHSQDSSLLLVLALALAPNEQVRAAQLALLDAQLGARRAARCETLRSHLERLDPALRMPILELTVPALKQRPTEQLEYLFDLAAKLGECGGERRLFDYLLLRMLAAYLSKLPGRHLALEPETKLSPRAACAILLAVVAAYGHDDADAALAAYRAGARLLRGALPEPPAPIESMRDVTRLDAALARLARVAPRSKKQVLEAVLATIRHDEQVGIEELELFRAIAATLGCPLPWDAGRDPQGRAALLRARTPVRIAEAVEKGQ